MLVLYNESYTKPFLLQTKPVAALCFHVQSYPIRNQFVSQPPTALACPNQRELPSALRARRHFVRGIRKLRQATKFLVRPQVPLCAMDG